MEIADIRQAIDKGIVRVSEHADEEMAADGLTVEIALNVSKNGEIIEEYPTDHPLPSSLILGFVEEAHPIHAVWAYNKATGRAVLVTIYRPDPDRWINWRVRKAKK